jgi:type I restriction enzyme S subunit
MVLAAELQSAKRSLPPGWRWVRLGEVCRDISDGTHFTPSYVSSGVPFLSVKDVKETGISFSDCRYISEEEHRQFIRRCKPEKGDVLYTKVGTTGIAKAIDTDREFSIFVSVALLKLTPAVLPLFLEKVLNSPVCRAQAADPTQGMANRNLVLQDLKRICVPIPPVREQERIAAILNEQMAWVERARAAAEAQLEAAKALPAAYLRAVFSSPEAQRWHKSRLADVGNIVSGITLGRKLKGAETRRVPYLRVANVKDGFLDLSDVYNIEATEAEITKCMLQQGDLLLTEGGDPDKLGRGSFWEGQIPECIHQNHIFRVRFDLTTVSPKFMSAQMASTYGKAYFLAHAKQTTGIATINQKVLGNFPLMMPPLDTQQHVAATLNEQMASAERARKAIEEELDNINKLPAALLHRAFAG